MYRPIAFLAFALLLSSTSAHARSAHWWRVYCSGNPNAPECSAPAPAPTPPGFSDEPNVDHDRDFGHGRRPDPRFRPYPPRPRLGTWVLTGALCPRGMVTDPSAVVGTSCMGRGRVECNFDGRKYYFQLRCQ
jgi:hypothetical protein